MKMKQAEFSLFAAAEMLDPKAKESSSSKSPFPWSRRETSTSSSNGGSPRIVTKAPPVPTHSVHTVQSYAKSQEEQNATCLSKTEHRYGVTFSLLPRYSTTPHGQIWTLIPFLYTPRVVQYML